MRAGHNTVRCCLGRIAIILMLLMLLLPTTGQSAEASIWSLAGHSKYQYIHTRIPENSVLQDINGDSLTDHNLEVRLKASARRNQWGFDTHLQFITVHSETLDGFREQPQIIFPGTGMINDDRRWFDLTHEISNQGKNATLLRLDRASVGYTGEKSVIRFGRQAISWGTGLLYTPMDIFNPFDPTAVDKEYKTGDDMLYGQYLLNNGNDFQLVAVVRRDPLAGEVEQNASSLAVKYHGFLGSNEYDLLLAEHYDERVLGLGASTDFAGAVWRGDLVWTETDSGSVFSTVAGVSYSWVAGGRNWTGFFEYFYNGFGQSDGNYATTDLIDNLDLLRRINRGEAFNLARHYVGASVTVEISPLLQLTPNVFINLKDPSALAQLVLSYDWQQDIQLLAAVNLPLGPDGSEFGGIESTQAGLFVSSGPSLFAQLAWYF